MAMSANIETRTTNEEPCCNCIHNEVCIHKDNYAEMIKTLKKEFDAWPEEDRNFMLFKWPGCKYHDLGGYNNR